MRILRYSDGSTLERPIIQVWEDLHNERVGYFRAFWCASPAATTGSPVVGYCSSGGTWRTIRQVVAECRRLGYSEPVYRNEKLVSP